MPHALAPVTVPQRVTTEAGQLRAQRIAYEEAQRAAAEAARRAELAALRREAAAYMIQNRWVPLLLMLMAWHGITNITGGS